MNIHHHPSVVSHPEHKAFAPRIGARACACAAALALAFVASTLHAQTTPYQNAVLSQSPLLYWTFDEPSGNAHSLVNDVAANELQPLGTATRAASIATPGGLSLGSAAYFPLPNASAGGRFYAANLAPTVTISNYAIEFWINLDNSVTNQYISENRGAPNEPGAIYNFRPDRLEFFGGNRTGAPATPNLWHHVVAGYYGTGGSLQIYLDGVQIASTLAGDTPFTRSHVFEQLSIGGVIQGDNVNPAKGFIDEYAIYDLSGFADLPARQGHVAKIAEHYTAVPEPGAVAFFAMAGVAAAARRNRGWRW